MAGYKIGDKEVAKTLVKAGKEKPWNPQKTSMGMEAPAGIFLQTRLGIVKEDIDACNYTAASITPPEGVVFAAKREGTGIIAKSAGLSGTFNEMTVYNLTKNAYEAGDIVLCVTDCFNTWWLIPFLAGTAQNCLVTADGFALEGFGVTDEGYTIQAADIAPTSQINALQTVAAVEETEEIGGSET